MGWLWHEIEVHFQNGKKKKKEKKHTTKHKPTLAFCLLLQSNKLLSSV